MYRWSLNIFMQVTLMICSGTAFAGNSAIPPIHRNSEEPETSVSSSNCRPFSGREETRELERSLKNISNIVQIKEQSPSQVSNLHREKNFLPKDYKFVRKLGSGDFGNVYLAEKENNLYAIKIFKDSYSQDYDKELENLNKLSGHCDLFPCIKDHGKNGNEKYIVMDYKTGKRFYFENSSNENIEAALKKLLNSLNTLFKLGVAHMDIKPDNIILDSDKGEVSIIDFGLSCIRPHCNHFRESEYYPPLDIEINVPIEMLQNLDIYAIGITIKQALRVRNKEECALKYNQKIANYLDLMNNELTKGRNTFNQLIKN